MNLVDMVRREVDRALSRGRNVVRKAVISVAASASYYLQATGAGVDVFDNIELWQQFGLASRPPTGGEALIACSGGSGEGAIAIATTDRAHRPAGLAEGDAALYAAASGGQAMVHVKADGDVDLTAKTGKHVHVGGSTEALLLGETVLADIKTFADALVAMPPTGTAVQNALALEAIRTAATALSGSTAAWLATFGKVA